MNISINNETILKQTDILNEIYVGIFICNSSGILLFINSYATKIFGIKAEDWIGRHMAELIPNSVIYRALSTETAQIGKHSKWKSKNFIVDALPIFVNNSLMGAISTVRDDNELQRLAQAYENLKSYVTMLETKLEYSSTLPESFSNLIVAPDSPMNKIIYKIQKAASTDIPILIRGESGVGKELIAKAIHDSSPKSKGPFITVNCAAIPEALLESELFGYEEGAFTGAKKNGKKGKFEIAEGGSIFLDEIGDMAYILQAKLLRVLQQKEIVKVGGNNPIPIDVRIITATHQNLESMIEEGKFREDLYYRINGTSFEIPPLRERKMDVKILFMHFLKNLSKKYNRKLSLDEVAASYLLSHPLPGNVRELDHALEHAVVMSDSDIISKDDFPKAFLEKTFPNKAFALVQQNKLNDNRLRTEEYETDTLNLNYHIQMIEKNLILKALKQTRYNRSEAIKLLGISRQTFYDRISKYKIEL